MKKYTDYGIYDFSDFAEELTGEAVIYVNGGACGGSISYSPSAPSGAPTGITGPSSPAISAPTAPSYGQCGGAPAGGGGGGSAPSSSSYGQCGGNFNPFAQCGGGTNNSNGNSDDVGSDNNTDDPRKFIKDYTNMTFSSVTECGGLKVEFVGQRNFSAFYSAYFGEHACAATSLLNEISEQYSRENGETVNAADLMKAMLDAVESGSIDATDATVNNWVEAANEMAESLGLEGTYKYSNDRNETDIKIFASDTDGDGKANHFVNDIGGGQYYDPWTGKTGNIADLTLATEGLGQTRNLSYTIKEG